LEDPLLKHTFVNEVEDTTRSKGNQGRASQENQVGILPLRQTRRQFRVEILGVITNPIVGKLDRQSLFVQFFTIILAVSHKNDN
jgi:hypothetical protein